MSQTTTPPQSPLRNRSSNSPQKLTDIPHNIAHTRNNSISSASSLKRTQTFTPRFIKSALRIHDQENSSPIGLRGCRKIFSDKGKGSTRLASAEEDLDFSGKRWVWVPDQLKAFKKGFVVKEEDQTLHVKCLDDDSDVTISVDEVEKVNPPKFDRVDDMAELTHLNEASVVYNLSSRYMADSIYVSASLVSNSFLGSKTDHV